MKSSIFLAASGAVLGMAAAIEKRAMETVWDVKWVTVTVTAGQEVPAQTEAPVVESEAAGRFFEEKPQDDAPPAPVYSTIVVVETPAAKPEVVNTPAAKPASTPAATPANRPVVNAPADGSMKEAALFHHNIHRQNHSAPALEWSQKHADYAMQTARTCVFAHDLSPGGGGYGQNLAMWGATNGDGLGATKAISQAATNMWYNGELHLYSPNFYGNEPSMSGFSGWGHFSQMVWVDTEEVGCAVHFCEKGTMNPTMGVWYSVCNYFPAGNVGGGFAKNVLPPGSADTVVA